MKKLCFMLIAAASVVACQPAGTTAAKDSFNLDSAKASINIANAAFSDAMAKSDSVEASNIYSKDACLMLPNMPKICGNAAIGGFIAGAKKMGIASMKITTGEVNGCNNLAYEDGVYEMFNDKSVSIEKGKYVGIWKLEDGKWKLYRDISNADAAAPMPMPAQK